MNDAQPSPDTLKMRTIRRALKIAQDVRAGTDGDPIAAATTLATAVEAIAQALRGAMATMRPQIRELIERVAPQIVTTRIKDPEGFEDFRGLFADLGMPELFDDLPTGWGAAAGLPGSIFDAAFGVGFGIGQEARRQRDEDLEADRDGGDEGDGHEMASVEEMEEAVIETLANHGVDVEPAAATAVVAKVLDLLGMEVCEPDGVYDGGPWVMGLQPDPEVSSVPAEVRARYADAVQSMLLAHERPGGAVAHAIFVSDARLCDLYAEVLIAPADAELLRAAWEGRPDPHGWGPSSDRPFAVWYPVLASIQDAPRRAAA